MRKSFYPESNARKSRILFQKAAAKEETVNI